MQVHDSASHDQMPESKSAISSSADSAVDSPVPTPPPALSATRPHPEFQKLASQSIGLTRLVNGITFAIIAALALAIGCLAMWFAPFPAQLIVPVVWLLIAVAAAVNVIWWPSWEHNGWSYRVGDKIFELRHGVVNHISVAIPLSRLQHVDVHRGPLERQWGLASLEIHTAGTRDAVHRIPGLDATIANGLRDQLIDAANRGTHAATRT